MQRRKGSGSPVEILAVGEEMNAKVQRRKGRGSLREIHYARSTTGDPRPRRGVGLPQRQIEIGLERFLWGVVRTVGVDFKAG